MFAYRIFTEERSTWIQVQFTEYSSQIFLVKSIKSDNSNVRLSAQKKKKKLKLPYLSSSTGISFLKFKKVFTHSDLVSRILHLCTIRYGQVGIFLTVASHLFRSYRYKVNFFAHLHYR